MRDMETVPVRRGPLDFLYSIRKRKKKTLRRVTGKFRGRRDGSLRCSRSDQRFLLPIIRFRSSFLLSHDESQGRRSIDWFPWFPRAIDPTITFAENSGRARQRLITISILRDLSLQKPSPLRKFLSRRFFLLFSFLFLLFSFYLSFYCCCSCYVILLLALTLAFNFAYCCRRWRSLKTIITFVLLQWIRDGNDSPHVAFSLCLFDFFNLFLSVLHLFLLPSSLFRHLSHAETHGGSHSSWTSV